MAAACRILGALPAVLSPFETLVEFGGFEIAMLTGAMLEVARHRCIVVVDGFAVSVAALLATEMDSRVRAHCVFSHCSAEAGHRKLLEHLQAQPLLDLRLRLGEGSGAALAWPLIESAARLMTEMASFEVGRRCRQGSTVTEIRLLLTAVQYFTRIRVPAWVGHAQERLTGAIRYFPVVGLIVGASGAATLWLAAQVLPHRCLRFSATA